MTNEEMLAKLENATEDETVELLRTFAGNIDDSAEELNEVDLEEVAGGASYATSVAAIYNRFRRLTPREQNKYKKKLNELIRKVLKHGKVSLPF